MQSPSPTTGQADVSHDITAISVGGTATSQFNRNPLVFPSKMVVSCPGYIVTLWYLVKSPIGVFVVII